ncbi:hypothetical protein NKR23_g354 [Pleurostoma richardsiae]|uniref:Myb-like domain-containing protein n=1 Tax=Pleurostoma richardsiae TaxID=41990 RepID=A0AA38RT39_9PEZI|nr:hypothetical protein NKR23_g354 [Pleurostoma richardsiae]
MCIVIQLVCPVCQFPAHRPPVIYYCNEQNHLCQSAPNLRATNEPLSLADNPNFFCVGGLEGRCPLNVKFQQASMKRMRNYARGRYPFVASAVAVGAAGAAGGMATQHYAPATPGGIPIDPALTNNNPGNVQFTARRDGNPNWTPEAGRTQTPAQNRQETTANAKNTKEKAKNKSTETIKDTATKETRTHENQDPEEGHQKKFGTPARWTEDETNRMLNLKNSGMAWKQIHKHIPTHSINALQSKNSQMKKKLEEEKANNTVAQNADAGGNDHGDNVSEGTSASHAATAGLAAPNTGDDSASRGSSVADDEEASSAEDAGAHAGNKRSFPEDPSNSSDISKKARFSR